MISFISKKLYLFEGQTDPKGGSGLPEATTKDDEPVIDTWSLVRIPFCN